MQTPGTRMTFGRGRAFGSAALMALGALAVGAPVSADVERERRGDCGSGSRWELSLEKEHGRIEVSLELDTPNAGRAWKVRMWHDGDRFFKARRTTDAEGEIDVERRRPDRAGRDKIRFKAVDTVSGEVCRGKVRI